MGKIRQSLEDGFRNAGFRGAALQRTVPLAECGARTVGVG